MDVACFHDWKFEELLKSVIGSQIGHMFKEKKFHFQSRCLINPINNLNNKIE